MVTNRAKQLLFSYYHYHEGHFSRSYSTSLILALLQANHSGHAIFKETGVQYLQQIQSICTTTMYIYVVVPYFKCRCYFLQHSLHCRPSHCYLYSVPPLPTTLLYLFLLPSLCPYPFSFIHIPMFVCLLLCHISADPCPLHICNKLTQNLSTALSFYSTLWLNVLSVFVRLDLVKCPCCSLQCRVHYWASRM